jgi:hypothetical protein
MQGTMIWFNPARTKVSLDRVVESDDARVVNVTVLPLEAVRRARLRGWC